MKLEITNGSLMAIMEYLPKLRLQGRVNRGRQKLLNKVAEKFKEYYSDFNEIKSDHPDDKEKQNELFTELNKEKSVLDMTEYESFMPQLYNTMLDYPHEIDTYSEPGKPSDALVHDLIIDVLEKAVETNEDGVVETQNTEETKLMEVE